VVDEDGRFDFCGTSKKKIILVFYADSWVCSARCLELMRSAVRYKNEIISVT